MKLFRKSCTSDMSDNLPMQSYAHAHTNSLNTTKAIHAAHTASHTEPRIPFFQYVGSLHILSTN